MIYVDERKKQQGFTLVEVLLSAGISAIISTIILGLVIQGSNIWQSVTSQSDLRSVARNALNYMSQELRNTTRASTENPSPNIAIPSKTNNRSIDFYLPLDIDDNGFIVDVLGKTEWDKSNKIQYQYIPGLKQLRRLEKGHQHIIANEVSDIRFEDNSINSALKNNELRITLNLSRSISGQKEVSEALTAVVKLRN
ncbi:MAG: type II secretion system protein [Candidatus Omnitrophica bacterium]|nr:type II secretion system protein [Candidatus Omnitrophota bacterium]